MRDDASEGERPSAHAGAVSVRTPQSKLRAGAIGAVALAVVIAAFSFLLRPRPADHAKASPAPVRVGVVARRDMAIIERSTGSVLPQTFVQVLPLVTGELKQQAFREGQFVKTGDLLFRIDSGPYRTAVAQVRAAYEKDRALLQNAQRDAQRFEELYKLDSASQQARDTAETNTKVLAATVASDRAALQAALLNLEHTEIRSPVSGKTGAVLIQPGNIVSAPTTNPLVTIAQVRPVKVSFSLPEQDLPRIQARRRAGRLMVRLDPDDPAGAADEAPVDFVANTVSSQSGTIELRASFPNKALALVPGQLVRVVVELGELQQTLVAPRDAVNDGPAGAYVYAVEGGRALVRPVTVLFDDGTNVALSGDLKPGEMVITEGQLRVDAGAKVHVLGRSVPLPKLASDRVHPAR